jgi:hypothetical protein
MKVSKRGWLKIGRDEIVLNGFPGRANLFAKEFL